MSDKIKLLESAVKKASTDKAFIAYYLEKYSLLENKRPNEIKDALDCSMEDYYKLGLCKVPEVNKPDFSKRLKEISAYTQTSILVLNNIVKRVSIIEKFTNSAGTDSYLMAARDKDDASGKSEEPDEPDENEKQDN